MADAIVRLGNKSQAWFDSHPSFLLEDGQLVYLNDNSGAYKKGDGVTLLGALPFITGGGSAVWGGITGDIDNQTDLTDYITAILINFVDYYTSVTTGSTIAVPVQSSTNLRRVTALSENATFSNPNGAIVNDGVRLYLAIKGDSTPRTLTFGSAFAFTSGVAAPTVTVPGQYLVLLFHHNTVTNKWDCILNSGATGGGSTAITAGVVPVGNGTSIQDSNLYWDETNRRLGVNVATPLATVHIKRDHTPSYGQKVIQSATTTGNATIIYESYYDSSNARVMVMGLGHYRSAGDMNYYFANEYAGGGVVFRNSSADTFEVTDAGTVIYKNQYSISSAPSIAAGAGAGTGPTITLATGSTNESGVITILTGTTPTIGGVVVTLTFSGSFAFPNGCSVQIGNADNATALASGSILMFATGTTTTAVITNYSGGALAATTTYKLSYQVKGY